MSTIKAVDISNLEKDERIEAVKFLFTSELEKESGFSQLSVESKSKVREVLKSLASMRFETRSDFVSVCRALLEPIASDLVPYIDVVVDRGYSLMRDQKGVLVIYTGGTIGSAPKDLNDPDSPQVVRPWSELKAALPNLGTLGYPVDAISFIEPLDSCNVGPAHWLTVCQIITRYYDDYSGFVMLHGTDSMVYTASALAFMLQGLTKPVVLTGSQVAGIVNARNDAHQNVITAIQIANPEVHGLVSIPEVVVAFGNRISRGCTSKKMDVIGYQGIYSVNYPLLGEAGEFVTIDKKLIRKVTQPQLSVLENIEPNVIVVEVFPGIQHSNILQNILSDESLKGVILKSYGAGNIPTDPKFLKLFKDFIDKGGIVINVTSVPEGEVVMGLYETSQILLDIGIIGGFDITPEAALTKLQVLLGNFDDREKVKTLMQQSIAGEQRLSLKSTGLAQEGIIEVSGAAKKLLAELNSVADIERIERVMCRFTNVKLDPGAQADTAKIAINLDHNGMKVNLGSYKRGSLPENVLIKDSSLGESLALDFTSHKNYFNAVSSSGAIDIKQQVSISLELEGSNGGSFSWDSIEINIYYTDQ